MQLFIRFAVFLAINLFTLALGGFLQAGGPSSPWYAGLSIAPWTPPGVVFGIAWFTLMVCFAIYMSLLTGMTKSRLVYFFYMGQLVLNIVWNPVFFAWHQIGLALILLCALFVLLGLMFYRFYKSLKWKSYWLLPYLLWLMVALSLNAFVWLMN